MTDPNTQQDNQYEEANEAYERSKYSPVLPGSTSEQESSPEATTLSVILCAPTSQSVGGSSKEMNNWRLREYRDDDPEESLKRWRSPKEFSGTETPPASSIDGQAGSEQMVDWTTHSEEVASPSSDAGEETISAGYPRGEAPAAWQGMFPMMRGILVATKDVLLVTKRVLLVTKEVRTARGAILPEWVEGAEGVVLALLRHDSRCFGSPLILRRN